MPYTIEPIHKINQRLKDIFGQDSSTGKAIWRVSWSEDQFEDRQGTYNDYSADGQIWLRTVTEVRRVPKYRQWLKELYVLEKLVAVPTINLNDLPDTKISYEPMFPFWDKNGNYLPPKWEVCEFVISLTDAARGKGNMARYSDGINTKEDWIVAKQKRINEMIEYLGGDESGLMGQTIGASGSGIIVPSSYEKSS